ncbi:MAG: 23S rRNA (adenine(1618)-N(6))-methyltransferase RlmF [Bacteroidales bacterium]|nr:23S rRNA (adenine(1618)-N(6))-methyltransferase RlmF [Bacteroidales bacterium]
MSDKKRKHPKVKSELHPRNKHRERYNLTLLTGTCPELIPFVKLNDYDDESIDFFNPEAVKALNTALLKHYYNIKSWDIPNGYLCPPIPGRADYIHNVADVLAGSNNQEIPKGEQIRILDIGVGANCVYPIIGNREYGWSFVGTEIDPVAIENAGKIVKENHGLSACVELRLQPNPKNIFEGIIHNNERFDFTMCNPPFHTSPEEAENASLHKLRNLKNRKISKPLLNFGGTNNELWCVGGEEKFVRDMVLQSKHYAASSKWFSTLISKQSNLAGTYKALKKVEAASVKTIAIGQGNKRSRIVAWTFLAPDQNENS